MQPGFNSVRGFHLADGLFLERLPEGVIEIRKVLPPYHDSSAVMFRIRASISSFASLVAAMSRRGDNAVTHREATLFLEEEEGPVECAADGGESMTVNLKGCPEQDARDREGDGEDRPPAKPFQRLEGDLFVWDIGYADNDLTKPGEFEFTYQIVAEDKDEACDGADDLLKEYCDENDLEWNDYEIVSIKRGVKVDLYVEPAS